MYALHDATTGVLQLQKVGNMHLGEPQTCSAMLVGRQAFTLSNVWHVEVRGHVNRRQYVGSFWHSKLA